jgi:hypothetical protein
MLHPTWSGYPTWLITRQSTVEFLSDLDYNFNLKSTWDLILIISDLFPLQFGHHSIQIKWLQRHPPTRHTHPSEFLHQQFWPLLQSQLTFTPIWLKYNHMINQLVGLNQQLGIRLIKSHMHTSNLVCHNELGITLIQIRLSPISLTPQLGLTHTESHSNSTHTIIQFAHQFIQSTSLQFD